MAITTGEVRASYANLFQPRVPDGGGDPKYSVTLLIPKTDTATLNAIYADIERAKQEGAQKFGGVVPAGCKTPLHDGDGVKQSGEPYGDECKGCMVMTASATQKPVIVGMDMQEILNPAEVYSGCYIRANINFFTYNRNGNKGVGCGLNAIQKVKDGEPLAMRVSAEEAFGGANAYRGATVPSPAGYPQQPASAQTYPGAAQGQYPAQQPAPYAAPGMGGYPPATPVQGYPQPATPVQGYPQPAVQRAVDPITGRPVQAGGVMGI